MNDNNGVFFITYNKNGTKLHPLSSSLELNQLVSDI